MFGLNTADRARLDTAAQNASTALTQLQAHEVRCTDRYEEIRRALGDYSNERKRDAAENRASRNRLLWMLGSAVLGIFVLIVKELVLRGLHP